MIMRSPFTLLAALLFALPASAQPGDVNVEPSVWDLGLGAHARELPTDEFVNFACGTNGGPPSTVIGGWNDFARCRAEAQTGWHEVYFEYDDEQEFIARAKQDEIRAALYENTSVYSRPVIATALFDGDGFLRGLRIVTDPRVPLRIREQAYTLGGFLQARTDGDWQCQNLEPREGETPFQGKFVKRVCRLHDSARNADLSIETHLYRRPGQLAINPADNQPTTGYFESMTRSEEFLSGEVPDRDARLAAIAALPAAEIDPEVERARDCAGCDLAGASLKRADLRNANLAGANLQGANLHGADLSGADLSGADLRNANLNRARLTRANLAGADLSSALLYEAAVDGANLSGATLFRILAGHSRWIRADLTGANVEDADLTAVRMTNLIAPAVSFARSRLWQAQLSQSDFTGGQFSNADMMGVVMTGASLGGAIMHVVNLAGADLRGSDLSGADLSGSRLTSAILGGADLTGTRFDGAVGYAPR